MEGKGYRYGAGMPRGYEEAAGRALRSGGGTPTRARADRDAGRATYASLSKASQDGPPASPSSQTANTGKPPCATGRAHIGEPLAGRRFAALTPDPF